MGRHGLKHNYGPYLEMINKKIKEDYAPETLLGFSVSRAFANQGDNHWSYWGCNPTANFLAKYAPKVGMPSHYYKKIEDFASNLYENHLDHCVYDKNDDSIFNVWKEDSDSDPKPPYFEKRTDSYRNFERVNIFKDEGYKRTFIDSPTLGYNFRDLIPHFKWKYRTGSMIDEGEELKYISFEELQKLINKTFKSHVYLDTNWFSGHQDYFKCNKIIFDSERIAWGPNSGLFWENSDNFGNPTSPAGKVTERVFVPKGQILKRYLNNLKDYRVLLPIGNLVFRIYDMKDYNRAREKTCLEVEIEFPKGDVDVPKAKGLIFQVKPTEDLEWEINFLHSLHEWSNVRSESHLKCIYESCFDDDKIADIIGVSFDLCDDKCEYFDQVRKGYDDFTPEQLHKLSEAIKNKEIFISPFSMSYCSTEVIGELEKFGPEIFSKFFNIIKVN